MQKYLGFALLFSTLAIALVLSQNCENILKNKKLYLQNDFNLTKYAGIWYEVRRNRTSSLKFSDCNRSKYTLITGTKEQINGSLLEAWNNQNVVTHQHGILNVTTAGDTTGNLTFLNSASKNETNHWVLKTNYNYSLVYSCVDIAQNGEENVIVLSRNKTIDPAPLKEVLDELKRYDFREPVLITTNQTQQCDTLMGGVPSIGPNGVIVAVHVLALIMLSKVL